MVPPAHAASVNREVSYSAAGWIWRRLIQAIVFIDVIVVVGFASVIVHDGMVERAISTTHWMVGCAVAFAAGQSVLLIFHRRRESAYLGRDAAHPPRYRRRSLNLHYPATRSGKSIGILLFVVAVGGFIQSFFAAIGTVASKGGPGQAIPTCRWPLVDHGVVTCVSHSAYMLAGAEIQRFILGIATFFYVAVTGVMADALTAPPAL